MILFTTLAALFFDLNAADTQFSQPPTITPDEAIHRAENFLSSNNPEHYNANEIFQQLYESANGDQRGNYLLGLCCKIYYKIGMPALNIQVDDRVFRNHAERFFKSAETEVEPAPEVVKSWFHLAELYRDIGGAPNSIQAAKLYHGVIKGRSTDSNWNPTFSNYKGYKILSYEGILRLKEENSHVPEIRDFFEQVGIEYNSLKNDYSTLSSRSSIFVIPGSNAFPSLLNPTQKYNLLHRP